MRYPKAIFIALFCHPKMPNLNPIKLLLKLFQVIVDLFFYVLTGGRKKKRVQHRLSPRKSMEMEDEKQQQKLAEFYAKFKIVVEHRLSLNVPLQPNTNTYYSNPNCSVQTREWINGKKWEFVVVKQFNSQQCSLKLTLLETDLDPSPVTAELVFWQWHRAKQIYILQKCVKTFQQAGSHYSLQCNSGNNTAPSDGFFNVLIRLLEKNEEIDENPCPPCGVYDEFLLRVGPEQFSVSKHYLMSISPVFLKMFSTDMIEKERGEVNIEETNPEEFGAFLEAISPKQTSPNPFNVLSLLKLADRFQIDHLRIRCEDILINCVEMTLIERLLCSEVYRLEKLKNFILKSLNGVGMREFYEENQSALNLLSKDLLIQLTVRICSGSKIDRNALCSSCAKNLNN